MIDYCLKIFSGYFEPVNYCLSCFSSDSGCFDDYDYFVYFDGSDTTDSEKSSYHVSPLTLMNHYYH